MKKTCFDLIAKEYDLGEVVSFEENNEGVLNKNYNLNTSKGKYFVKGFRDKAKSKIEYIAEVEKIMHENDIPAVGMLRTKFGDNYLCVDNDLFVVYPFIDSDRSHAYNSEDYAKIGRMLARIHEVSSVIDVQTFRTNELKSHINHDKKRESMKKYYDLIKSKSDKNEVDRKFLEYIELKFDVISTSREIDPLTNTHLLHGDYHVGNLLISKEGREIVGIIDWEKSEVGPRAYELARSLLYTAYDLHSIESDIENIWREMLGGYCDVSEISDMELQKGLSQRIERHVYSTWIEEAYL